MKTIHVTKILKVFGLWMLLISSSMYAIAQEQPVEPARKSLKIIIDGETVFDLDTTLAEVVDIEELLGETLQVLPMELNLKLKGLKDHIDEEVLLKLKDMPELEEEMMGLQEKLKLEWHDEKLAELKDIKIDIKELMDEHHKDVEELQEEVEIILKDLDGEGIMIWEDEEEGQKEMRIIIDHDNPGDENVHIWVDKAVEDGNKRKVVIARVMVLELEVADNVWVEEIEVQKKMKSTSESLLLEEVDFYPNPNDGRFILSFNLEKQSKTEVKIYNNAGEEVFSKSLRPEDGSFSINVDISDQPKGVYLLRVTQGKKVANKKIVVQ